MKQRKITLRLDNGMCFHGTSFGYEASAAGEVVFNTSMSGYPESLTDPSYAGQILVLTYPLIGNYGVPSFSFGPDGLASHMESDRIHVRALIVGSYSDNYSHWNACESLADWLCRERIPAVTGIDTRALTKVLREQGVMMGELVFDDVSAGWVATKDENTLLSNTGRGNSAYESVNWVEQVSCKEIIRYNEGADKRIVLLDCGVKHNIIRHLLKRGVEVIRVPWDYDFNNLQFDGLFLSNGPGDPNTCDAAVQHIRTFLGSQHVRPLMGICMGNQLLAKAAGGAVYKLPYGHRSHNQPVRMEGTNRCFITSQNHGYAVDPLTLPAEWRPYFTNMNDNSNEGIRHTSRPWFSAQFHPEAASGPTDTEFLFDDFASLL